MCLKMIELCCSSMSLTHRYVTGASISFSVIRPETDGAKKRKAPLAKIGAIRICQLFDRALTVFPDGTPSEDHLTRATQLCEIGKDAERLLQELTGEYYDLYRDHPEEETFTKIYYFLESILGREKSEAAEPLPDSTTKETGTGPVPGPAPGQNSSPVPCGCVSAGPT